MKNYLLSFFLLSAALILLPKVPSLFPEEEVRFLPVLDAESGEVFSLPLEDYVIGRLEVLSLPSEAEARKAAAVAVRSMALYCEEFRPVHKNAALCNDPACCGGFTTEEFSPENIAAASETAGEFMIYEGKPAALLFHESAGRYTASAGSIFGIEVPYLTMVKNVEEGVEQELVLTKETFLSRLGIPQSTLWEDLFWGYDRSGYLLRLEWEGGFLTGEQTADLLSLPSSAITAEMEDGTVRILCRGRGHGVGMSLNGASLLAREGKDYREILAFYFPLAEILLAEILLAEIPLAEASD